MLITDFYGADIISFQCVTIESLPDNVLLDIFDFYQKVTDRYFRKWPSLIQVCRRWRYLVFVSPCRLGLQFLCGATTPVKEILDAWPPMQIVVNDYRPTRLGGDNIIAALEHSDRVIDISLSYLTSSLLGRLAIVMQEPFPVLTHLRLSCDGQTPLVLPDTFLGGSAPRLRSLWLYGIPFPALPKLLLSTPNLVSLDLLKVPHTGYISPEAMVTCLATLTNLESLSLRLQSPSSRPNQGSQPPPPPVVLSALTKLEIQGVSEYLEDFLVRINTPLITTAKITFYNRINFVIPQLVNFVSRTEVRGSVKWAELFLNNHFARLSIHRPDSPQGRDLSECGFPNVGVLCDAFDWKISFLVQICSQLLPLLSSVERLDIRDQRPLDWEDADHMQWLEIFRPFIAVQSLHIHGLAKPITSALNELIGVRVMEVLPALHSIFVTCPAYERQLSIIEPFITERRLSNRPVTVVY